jgi:hypothetical protein
MSNWNLWMELKTNKISIKNQEQKLEIKRIRIGVEIPTTKRIKLYFLGVEREKKKKKVCSGPL